MGQNRPNVHLLTVVVDGGDEAGGIAANIEDS